MGQLTSNGYEIQTFAEWKALIQAAFTASWPGIVLTEQSPQGVWINQLATWLSNADLDGLNFFNNMNLNNATGAMLSFIAILRGTLRNDGTEALFNVTLTSSTYPYTIPAGTQFTLMGTSLVFQNPAIINVTSGSQVAQLEAIATGVTNANIGDKLQSVQTISQLTDISILTVTEGTDDETDNELRARLKSINSISSGDDVDAIYSALKGLANTVKATVYENDTNYGDTRGIPAGSINAVVLGNADQDIVNVLGLKKPAGIPTYGASSGVYTDSQGYAKTIYFDRPTEKRIYIAASVTTKPNQIAIDGSYDALIRSQCQEFINDLDIGESVSYTTIYGIFACPITQNGQLPVSPFDIVNLEMSIVSPSASLNTGNVAIGTREYAWLEDDTNDILITVI